MHCILLWNPFLIFSLLLWIKTMALEEVAHKLMLLYTTILEEKFYRYLKRGYNVGAWYSWPFSMKNRSTPGPLTWVTYLHGFQSIHNKLHGVPIACSWMKNYTVDGGMDREVLQWNENWFSGPLYMYITISMISVAYVYVVQKNSNLYPYHALAYIRACYERCTPGMHVI